MPLASIRFSLCPTCVNPLVPTNPVQPTTCPRCRYRVTPVERRFGEGEWKTEETPEWIVGCLGLLGIHPSKRKSRLLYTAVARIGFEWCQNARFRVTIDTADDWADSGRQPRGVENLRQLLPGHYPEWKSAEWDWRELAVECLAAQPSCQFHNFRGSTQQLFADAYRELIPTPFVPLKWDSGWFTSTVRELASHIYEQREFSTMSILADALEDAGCDHSLILEHCRSPKPHARGCWVVDAILGKT